MSASGSKKIPTLTLKGFEGRMATFLLYLQSYELEGRVGREWDVLLIIVLIAPAHAMGHRCWRRRICSNVSVVG
ncbi:hypothetical protein HaLaN_26160 [Haematococcus lacustris]|uniref:Uncharacterized protein n=1 Tax=Haematococcus lacustris TaxID=44745 RepID=A0A6A0A5K2_HAELA|nr:hypothetical protein HaLaN_26160 [Haematococcus lacustris]